VRRALATLLVLCSVGGAGCGALSRMSGSSSDLHAVRRGAPRPADLGQVRFVFDDFGTLNTHTLETYASPWKLYTTALLMIEAPRLGLPVARSSLRPVLEQFGFLFPDSIGNWDPRDGPPPAIAGPLGSTRATIHGWIPGLKLEVRNTGCATCHGGRLYDAQGLPTRTAWIGLPNTWLDLEGYSEATFAGLKLAMRDERAFLRTTEHLYPEMSWGERYVCRHVVIPRVRRALKSIVAERDRALVFDNGGPGLANGVASLKFQLGIISKRAYAPQEMAIASIPDLSDRALRSSLLYDGTYAVRGDERFRPLKREEVPPDRVARFADIASFFTITTSGNDAATAERIIPRMREALRSLATYLAPPFPGGIDDSLAARGREVFTTRCSGCHGRYEASARRPRLAEYPNALVPSERIGTDSLRWMSVDDSVLSWQAHHPSHPFVRHVATARTGGYVPPILTGVWATAPYLHNGSVPTLWALMHPDDRPARFEVGGHRLDYARMGIDLQPDSTGVWRYPKGYVPGSRPVVYDTSRLGRGNGGHRFPFRAMGEDDKAAVLEYLKTL
jgi:mono/diheme cytochrome c family protein